MRRPSPQGAVFAYADAPGPVLDTNGGTGGTRTGSPRPRGMRHYSVGANQITSCCCDRSPLIWQDLRGISIDQRLGPAPEKHNVFSRGRKP
jgi:hypothetical protein